MIIGDDWFTKTMLINSLTRNERLRTQLAGSLGNENPFFDILTQFMAQKERQTPVSPGMIAYSPDFFTRSLPGNLNEPLQFQPVSAEKLDQALGGKLTGMGKVFVQAGQQYNINPALLAAIAQHETGNGTSKAAYDKNNIAGMMGKNGLKSYASVEESITDMSRNLSKNYLAKGLTSIADIGAKYAPVGASNDPTGLNNHWVTGVTRFFNQLLI